jgi:hypothetical protein
MGPVDAAEVGQELEPALVVEPPGHLGPVGSIHGHDRLAGRRGALRHDAREAGDHSGDGRLAGCFVHTLSTLCSRFGAIVHIHFFFNGSSTG